MPTDSETNKNIIQCLFTATFLVVLGSFSDALLKGLRSCFFEVLDFSSKIHSQQEDVGMKNHHFVTALVDKGGKSVNSKIVLLFMKVKTLSLLSFERICLSHLPRL